MAKLNCLLCQVDIPPTTTEVERDAHLCRLALLIDKTLQQHAVDLIVLPELSSIDYSREAFSHLDKLAETDTGPSFEVWSQVARRHNAYVIYGFAARIETGFTIACAVLNQTGELLSVYHKLHLAQFGDSMEKEYFSTGHRRLCVFQLNGFTIAPIICYDIRMPELCRTLVVDHGIDIVLHTGAYARDPSFHTWHAFAQTRAVENQVYFVSLNRAGVHFGSSIVCPPWIDSSHLPVYFDHHREECRLMTMERRDVLRARSDYTFLQDRLDNYHLPIGY